MSPALESLQARLGYVFRQPALLLEAVTHPSYRQEHPGEGDSNQRLEFLGDAVLQLILTERLFELFPADREGMLSKRRAKLIEGKFLSSLALELGLDACLRLGSAEEAAGGRLKRSALEDAMEGLAGALYLDAGFAEAGRIVRALYGSLPDRIEPVLASDNPKGRLQELVQPRHGNQAVRYAVVRVTGADHARRYEVAVYVNELALGTGQGTSKKLAEEAAAAAALAALQEKG